MDDDRQEPWAGKVPENGSRPSGGRPPPARRNGTEGAPAERREPAAGPSTPAGEPNRARPATAAWSGRAEVPPPRSARPPEAPGEWYVEEPGDRRWWMPILVASVALAVLAMLGLGLWLIVRSGTDTPRAPLPSPSAMPPTTGPSTPPGTGAATRPARVPMPDLVGLPRSVAEAALDRLGLGYRSELRRSDRPSGTVVGTEPRAGEQVPVGTDVTLVVSEGGPSRPAAASPTPDRTPDPIPGATRTPTGGATGRAVTTSGGATPP